MKLIGGQKKQLQDALISAFPDKNKVEQLVSSTPPHSTKSPALKKENLEKRLAQLKEEYTLANEQIDITNNKVDCHRLQKQADDLYRQMEKIDSELNQIDKLNITDIINLIETAEAEGRVEPLIEGASKLNPDNAKLKEFIKQYYSISELFNILTPLEKKFMHEMTQAYRACRNKGYEDWEDSTDTLEQILTYLMEMPEANAPFSPIVQFVAQFLLLLEDKLPQKATDELRNWGANKEDNFQIFLNQLNNKNRVSRTAKDTPSPTYLLIRLEESPSGEKQKQKQYFMSAWFFIPDECSSQAGINKNQYDRYRLDITDEQQKLSLKEIPEFIENLIFQINKKIYKIAKQSLMIMLFLPLQTIIKERIDCMPIPKIRNSSLGSEYQILFRNNDRVNKFGDDWERKWALVEKDVHSTDNTILYEECQEELIESLMNIRNNDKLVCVKLIQPPSQTIMSMIERESIPVIVWLRKTIENSRYQQELQDLKTGKIAELPKRVQEKRFAAIKAAIKDKTKQHIGHHLTLLWENPYILPPDANFQYKIAE
ncbi:hypothetical protein F7734_57425 [Scytonema sp. UIC 10036]|uniref:VMAP-C domain-containing protein n=1 Tax=Scytonema sp. UIC 10036 TaxID=2304196 RepID=UPI0012DA7E1C|nr:effector-associated domain EAD1-containing protein [Scytonema sp. UIC 10036]MUH01351.1 hypothetical protein [Scytonema sp. UIC 10036]